MADCNLISRISFKILCRYSGSSSIRWQLSWNLVLIVLRVSQSIADPPHGRVDRFEFLAFIEDFELSDAVNRPGLIMGWLFLVHRSVFLSRLGPVPSSSNDQIVYCNSGNGFH
jgi:hypothetical protein